MNDVDDSEIKCGQIVTSLTSCDHGGSFLTKFLKAISVPISDIFVCSSHVRKAGGMAEYFSNVSLLFHLPDCKKLECQHYLSKVKMCGFHGLINVQVSTWSYDCSS